MIEYVELIILGLVQGITEFLPVSSDGHLAIVGDLFAAASGRTLEVDQLAVTVVLHLGTLLAVLIVFRRELWRLLGADRRVLGLLAVATLPAAIGIPAGKYCADLLGNPLLAGLMLPINGALLLWIARKQPGNLDYTELTFRQALLMGLCQATALLPGISRSGTTIVAGLALGLRREAAATFSFLLSVPAIGGAVTITILKLLRNPGVNPPVEPLVVGTLVSFVVGLACLNLLLSWVKQGRLRPFAWWCIGLGVIVIVWQLVKLTAA